MYSWVHDIILWLSPKYRYAHDSTSYMINIRYEYMYINICICIQPICLHFKSMSVLLLVAGLVLIHVPPFWHCRVSTSRLTPRSQALCPSTPALPNCKRPSHGASHHSHLPRCHDHSLNEVKQKTADTKTSTVAFTNAPNIQLPTAKKTRSTLRPSISVGSDHSWRGISATGYRFFTLSRGRLFASLRFTVVYLRHRQCHFWNNQYRQWLSRFLDGRRCRCHKWRQIRMDWNFRMLICRLFLDSLLPVDETARTALCR